MKNLSVQLKLMMKGKSFIITFSFMMIFSAMAFVIECISSFNSDYNSVISAKYHFLGSMFIDSQMNYIYLIIFPLIAVIPFADSYFEERENKTTELCLARISNSSYYFSKLGAVFCSAILITAVPLFCNLLLNFIAFPFNSTVDNTNFSYARSRTFETAVETDIFKDLLSYNINLYNILHIVLVSIFCGLVAVVVYQLSFFYKKSRIMLLCSFFIIYTFFDVVLSAFGKKEFCPSIYLFGGQFFSNQSIKGMIIVFVSISTAAFLPIPFAKKRLDNFYE